MRVSYPGLMSAKVLRLMEAEIPTALSSGQFFSRLSPKALDQTMRYRMPLPFKPLVFSEVSYVGERTSPLRAQNSRLRHARMGAMPGDPENAASTRSNA